MSNVNNTAAKVVDGQIDSHSKAQGPKLSINGDSVDSEQWGRRLRIAFELADPHQLKEHLAKHVHGSRAAASSGTSSSTSSGASTDTAAASNFDPDNPRHLRHALYTLSVKENSDVCLLYTSPSPRD